MKKITALFILMCIIGTALFATGCDASFLEDAKSDFTDAWCEFDGSMSAFADDVAFAVSGEHTCTAGEWTTYIEAENCQKDGFRCQFCTRCGVLLACERIETDHVLGEITEGAAATCRDCDYTFGTVPYYATEGEETSAVVTGFGLLGYINRSNITKVYIPDEYETLPTETIASYAFYGLSSITSVRLPGSIKTVEASAFDGCKRLSDIEFDGTLEMWNAIDFGENWDNGMDAYTVRCTDGTSELTRTTFD